MKWTFPLKILFIIFLVGIDSQEWQKPYFNDPNMQGIRFLEGSDFQTIQVDEEIPWPFTLAIINYKGEIKPNIGKFSLGNLNLLNPTIIQENDVWMIQIDSRQDYENEKQRRYQFEIVIGSEEPQEIYMFLENIFDNDPSITYNGPCKAEELETNVDALNCTFRIYDPDGMENNTITLKITGSYGEDELFAFRNYIPVDSFQRDYTLYIMEELHYEQRILYNFRVTAFDRVGNNKTIPAILEVIDLPNMDPIWVKPFATATFDEKTEKDFVVQAVDGDTGINKTIWYRLEFNPNEDYSSLISINRETGLLHVNPIDRDALAKETFTFSICAYKYDNASWFVCSPAIIIVKDINDNLPEITIAPINVAFMEETYMTVPLDTFIVNDIDLSIHATYNISLQRAGTEESLSGIFELIPNSGYQKASFRLSINDAQLLDYEDEFWRNFVLTIMAREVYFPDNKTTQNLQIELINWNDEIPEFENATYSVQVKETVPENSFLAQLRAVDRDVGDKVLHEIVGYYQGITITEDDGIIRTISKDALDYERQKTVIIQVKATDTLVTETYNKLNLVYAQLTINVIDVNDETPEIRMPRNSPNITENSNGSTLVTDMIQALDPDTTADLEFEIDWDTSYATKSGKEANQDTYENCFIIEKRENTKNHVYGHLKVNPEFRKKIDYEMYENIYLTIRVKDLAQEVNDGTAEGTLTIRVDDVNDNPPQFIKDTLRTERNVVEEASSGTLVGTIFAEDIDGPGNNEIHYFIRPKEGDEPGTKEELIDIEENTGVLKVAGNALIDCDVPKISGLNFTIILSDDVWETQGDIYISIADINNKIPELLNFNHTREIYENSATGEFIQNVLATDLDRDEPHNTLQFSINNPLPSDVRRYFQIDPLTGEVIVNLQGDALLDRDNGQPNHTILINIQDNYLGTGRTNSLNTNVTVILLDINDNAPEMPDPSQFQPVISENTQKDSQIGDRFIALDKDEPDTCNSWVSYKILQIKPLKDNAEDIKNFEDLFYIEGDARTYGQIYPKKDLKGFYGVWSVEIFAYDHGDEGVTGQSLNSTGTFNITVLPFNFHSPKIVYPKKDDILRLRYNGQEIGKPLYTTESTFLPVFTAYDPDGGNYGDIHFEISNYNVQSNDESYFEIIKETRTDSRLQVTKKIEPKFYRINLKAVDGGLRSSETLPNLVIVFVDMEGEPVFENLNFTTNFTENEFGLNETRVIPEAKDPKNEGIQEEKNKFQVFYYIDTKFNPADAKLFHLDNITRTLKLKEELDREKIDTHYIRVIATNKKEGPSTNPDENSILLLTIKVNDVNDNPPVFDEYNYGAGITTNDYRSKVILTVHATDPDLNDSTTYLIDENSLITKGENIEAIKGDIFAMNGDTGEVSLIMIPTNNMKGYFQFDIQAIDNANHSDSAHVKIFIVSESNRVTFVFLTNYKIVKNNTQFLKEKFQELYGYDTCNIDEIVPYRETRDDMKENNGTMEDEDATSVRAHFIQNNEAIEAAIIQQKSNDITFVAKLKNSLLARGLILNDVPLPVYDNLSQNMESLLTTVLIVVSLVLGTLCCILLAAFVMKTRALNRQLKAFSAPEFGSTPSNLNRRMDAPTTNVFSVQGSNPILNDSQMKINTYDEVSSVESYESDLVGINNDPIFMKPESDENDNVRIKKESNTSTISDVNHNQEVNHSNRRESIESNSVEETVGKRF